MTCEGCANACKRILSKIEGVTEVKTDVAEKVVEVTHTGVEEQVMFDKLKKWSDASGKTLAKWEEV
jgi:copper chaperone